MKEVSSVEVCVRNGVETYSFRHPSQHSAYRHLEWLKKNNKVTQEQWDTAKKILTESDRLDYAYINCTEPLNELRIYPKNKTLFTGYHVNRSGDIVKTKEYAGGYGTGGYYSSGGQRKKYLDMLDSDYILQTDIPDLLEQIPYRQSTCENGNLYFEYKLIKELKEK